MEEAPNVQSARLVERLRERVRVVLVETSLPANIGSAARAMKTMGLSRLVLVQPKRFPNPEAIALASGADDLLERAQVVESLPEALAGTVAAFGLAASRRGIRLTEYDARTAAGVMLEQAAGGDVALVLGTERVGLTNAELLSCTALVTIRSDPGFSSLNLAQALQVMAHELRMAALGDAVNADAPVHVPAPNQELDRLIEHYDRVLQLIDFYGKKHPRKLLTRIRRLYQRAMPSEQELNVLRGVLSETERTIAAAVRGSEVVRDRYERLGVAARLPRALRRRDPLASSGEQGEHGGSDGAAPDDDQRDGHQQRVAVGPEQ